MMVLKEFGQDYRIIERVVNNSTDLLNVKNECIDIIDNNKDVDFDIFVDNMGHVKLKAVLSLTFCSDVKEVSIKDNKSRLLLEAESKKEIEMMRKLLDNGYLINNNVDIIAYSTPNNHLFITLK